MSTYDDNQWATPNIDVDTFNPTGLDISQWMTAIATSGAKYATLTVKHHDGFSLYPTAHYSPGYDPYSIAQTAWYAANGSPDIVDLFVTACRANNIIPCFYFSFWDRTFEARTGAAVTGDAGYLNLVETQLRELLTNYGQIGAIWIDAYTGRALTVYIPYAHIYNFIKSIQSNCMIVHNEHVFPPNASQVVVYEVPVHGNVPEGNTSPAEESDTVDQGGAWFYPSAGVTLKTASTIQASIIQANSRNAAYHLNFSPNTVGIIPEDQVTLLGQIP